MGSGRRRGLTIDCIRAGLTDAEDWGETRLLGTLQRWWLGMISVLMLSMQLDCVPTLTVTFMHVDGEVRWIDP